MNFQRNKSVNVPFSHLYFLANLSVNSPLLVTDTALQLDLLSGLQEKLIDKMCSVASNRDLLKQVQERSSLCYVNVDLRGIPRTQLKQSQISQSIELKGISGSKVALMAPGLGVYGSLLYGSLLPPVM